MSLKYHCDLCPAQAEPHDCGLPVGWYRLTAEIDEIDLQLCGQCAAPVVAAKREQEK